MARRWVGLVLAVMVLAFASACASAGEETLGGNRVFKFDGQFYAVRCEPVRADLLADSLGRVPFEDRSLAIRLVDGVERGEAIAAQWPECAAASEPVPWILAVPGPESGAVDYEPYRELLAPASTSASESSD